MFFVPDYIACSSNPCGSGNCTNNLNFLESTFQCSETTASGEIFPGFRWFNSNKLCSDTIGTTEASTTVLTESTSATTGIAAETIETTSNSDAGTIGETATTLAPISTNFVYGPVTTEATTAMAAPVSVTQVPGKTAASSVSYNTTSMPASGTSSSTAAQKALNNSVSIFGPGATQETVLSVGFCFVLTTLVIKICRGATQFRLDLRAYESSLK